jgi:RND family efflux transporter MFP subunit
MVFYRVHTILTAVVITPALLLLAGCAAESSPPSKQPIRTVQTAPARLASELSARSFSGTLRAPKETRLSFRVPGEVSRVPVDVGSRVGAGALVAALDREDYQLEVEAAAASYQQAQASAENAKAELQRIKVLYANDNASLSAYDRARTSYKTTQNAAEAVQRKLQLARKRLGYTRLRAPTAGSIASVLVEEGENVSAGQPVARLASGDALEVQVQVPEDVIADLQTGDSARVHTAVRSSGSAGATVTEVGVAPDGRQPTYPVIVTLDASDEALRPGMTARVQFDLGSATGLVVPPEAVGQDQNGRFAYVVQSDTLATDSRADGRIVRRSVTTGDLTPHGLTVTSGLQRGDRVVTAGLSEVRDGDPVRISRLLSGEL